ncbi:hypothetical protein CR970_03890 [Candidatus Saccharibacteria bacterium]|nr:MAG: hypothetical protein CR970_03890 [Candidatus Saccharibacteria bacterium]
MSDLTKPLKDYWRGQGGGAAKRGPSSLETAARGGTQPKRVRAVSEDAACRGVDPSTFKGDEGLQELVALCGSCPVRAACLAEGMDRDTEKKSPKRETAYAGVYGGFDRGQRDQLRQAATGVLNWDATLEHIWPIVEKDPSWQAPESIGFLAVNSAAAAARTKEVPLPTYNLPAAG